MDFFQIVVVHGLPWAIHLTDSLNFWTKGIFRFFMIFFSIFVNKVILGSLSAVRLENMITKTLLLLQIAVIIYETSSELSSQLSSQNSVWDFWLKRPNRRSAVQ